MLCGNQSVVSRLTLASHVMTIARLAAAIRTSASVATVVNVVRLCVCVLEKNALFDL